MYDFKYQYLYQSGSTPNSKYQHKTVLTAKFSFDNEVPRNRRAEVKKRLSLNDTVKRLSEINYSIEQSSLDRFIKRIYMPDYSDALRGRVYFRGSEVVKITPFLWGLGFNLRSEAQGQSDINKMINLEALNQFVLAGELSPIVEEQLQRQA